MLCLYPVGGWAGSQMEGWAFLPLQKAALQRNSTAVSESVWSCFLALSLLFPPAVLFSVKGAEESLELMQLLSMVCHTEWG